MKFNTFAFAAALVAFPVTAMAAGTHTGGHDEYEIGMKAEKASAKRTINVTMRETEDGKMLFEPKSLNFNEGETVILNFTNKGEVDHEFVMDTEKNVQDHKVAMEKDPDMEHADDNSLRLAPGAKGQIVWTFSKGGTFSFACLIPGHYESGMHGLLKVNTSTTTAAAKPATAPAVAPANSEGTIKKIDLAQKKITIKHGPLKELDMPSMTMVFAAGDSVDLTKLKPGQKVKFAAARVNGRLTVTEVK